MYAIDGCIRDGTRNEDYGVFAGNRGCEHIPVRRLGYHVAFQT